MIGGFMDRITPKHTQIFFSEKDTEINFSFVLEEQVTFLFCSLCFGFDIIQNS